MRLDQNNAEMCVSKCERETRTHDAAANNGEVAGMHGNKLYAAWSLRPTLRQPRAAQTDVSTHL
jgi:hypothetical protein